jgi:hypothetical protein
MSSAASMKRICGCETCSSTPRSTTCRRVCASSMPTTG